MRLLWWIVVGLIAGWATGKIMKGSGYGVLLDIVVGVLQQRRSYLHNPCGYYRRSDSDCGCSSLIQKSSLSAAFRKIVTTLRQEGRHSASRAGSLRGQE